MLSKPLTHRLIVKGLGKPWQTAEIDVYLVREDPQSNDAFAYFTIPGVRGMIAMPKGSSYGGATKGLKDELPDLTALVPGKKTKFFIELGVFMRAMKQRFTLDDKVWPDKKTIETALQELVNAIETQMENEDDASGVWNWDLCLTPDGGIPLGRVLPRGGNKQKRTNQRKRKIFNDEEEEDDEELELVVPKRASLQVPPRRSASAKFAAIVAREKQSSQEEEDDAAAAMVASLSAGNSPGREDSPLRDNASSASPPPFRQPNFDLEGLGLLPNRKPAWVGELMDMVRETQTIVRDDHVSREALLRYQMSEAYLKDKEELVRSHVQQRMPEIERELETELNSRKRALEPQLDEYLDQRKQEAQEYLDQRKQEVEAEVVMYRQRLQADVEADMGDYKRRRIAEINEQIVREQPIAIVGDAMNIQTIVRETIVSK